MDRSDCCTRKLIPSFNLNVLTCSRGVRFPLIGDFQIKEKMNGWFYRTEFENSFG
jgi:hypothetical protein